MTRIKICGITNVEDAMAAVKLGADAIGFVFAGSQRKIDRDTARKISQCLPPFVSKIGVFVDEQSEEVRETAGYCGLDAVQLHGDESPAYLEALNLPVIKAFRVKDHSILEQIRVYNLPHILLDTYVGDQSGGTGKSFDWDIARQANALGRVILGGGLNGDNIENALITACPFAVDVSSGVEASPGKKDMRKLETFITKVRLWDNRTN